MLAYMMSISQHPNDSASVPESMDTAGHHGNGKLNETMHSAIAAGQASTPTCAASDSPALCTNQTAATPCDLTVHADSCPPALAADQGSHLASETNFRSSDAAVSSQSQQLEQQVLRPDQEGMASELSQRCDPRKLMRQLTGSLTCNELDPARRARLQTVLKQYLPPHVMHKIK